MIETRDSALTPDGSWTDYGWLVDRDVLDGEDTSHIGPRTLADSVIAQLQRGDGTRFRMFDDDGELYYEGLLVGDVGEHGFGPLDDFGAPNAGCTTISYFIDGEWSEL